MEDSNLPDPNGNFFELAAYARGVLSNLDGRPFTTEYRPGTRARAEYDKGNSLAIDRHTRFGGSADARYDRRRRGL